MEPKMPMDWDDHAGWEQYYRAKLNAGKIASDSFESATRFLGTLAQKR